MIRFGPSGNSNAFYEQGHKSTTEAPAWCAAQGLNAYEYSFGRGINVSDKKANEIGAEGKKHDVAISVHAPYYIEALIIGLRIALISIMAKIHRLNLWAPKPENHLCIVLIKITSLNC